MALEQRKTIALPVRAERYGMLITNSKGTIISVDDDFCAITGYHPHEVIGKNPCLLKQGDGMFYRMLLRYLQETENWQGEIWLPCKDGHFEKRHVQVSALKNSKNKPVQFLVVFGSCYGKPFYKPSINYVVRYDALTGLPNRQLFDQRLSRMLRQRPKASLSVLFLDLDRLKVINDTLGYSVGDMVLQAVAQRLISCLGEKNIVARLGGDEFIIMLNDISASAGAEKVAQRILKELSRPFSIKGHELFVGVSIGISTFPEDGKDTDTLVRNAETAMDRVKQQGRNRYRLYVPDMNSSALERLKLGNDLRRAIEREEFVLHYQPQVELKTGKIIGVEALLRWQHPEEGLIYPDSFISIAEETGLIVQVGEWVLRTACSQNKAWAEAGLGPLSVAVNLSARQFQQQALAKTISTVLKETGLKPDYLELEITESVTMQDIDYTMDTLSKLKKMSIAISVDDFGTGYCSLTYLRKYPIDKLKIDKAFIQDTSGPDKDNAIVRAIIALAKSLNLKVVAEGVENRAQMEFLRRQGCHGAQGYLFGKPMPAEEIKDVLKKGIKIKED